MKHQAPAIAQPAPIAFTQAKYAQLQVDLEKLELLRKEVIARLQTAREMGDLSENGAYIYAKRELGNTDRQIRQTQYFLKYGKIIQTSTQIKKISIGHKVTLEFNGKLIDYTLIGTQEADPFSNLISTVSPLGKALLGKTVGETAIVTTPRGEISYIVKNIAVADL